MIGDDWNNDSEYEFAKAQADRAAGIGCAVSAGVVAVLVGAILLICLLVVVFFFAAFFELRSL